jgi:hypothetical protein
MKPAARARCLAPDGEAAVASAGMRGYDQR